MKNGVSDTKRHRSTSGYKGKMKVLVAQSCLTLCDPMDYIIAYQAPLSMGFSRQ